jgi:SAM-dependent methyltransferase
VRRGDATTRALRHGDPQAGSLANGVASSASARATRGLADEYDAFVDCSSYFASAENALRRLLGHGPGRCLDVGCGGGHFFQIAVELGWDVVGVDVSADQLRAARDRHPDVELVRADAATLPFGDGTFHSAFSTFTHTDFDDFAGAVSETQRVLRPGGRFVYVGNHPCFVGPTQEHTEAGVPRLHPGYRRSGRWQSGDAPGTTPSGWRERLGSFVHLPLGDFLAAFTGLTLVAVEELADAYEYPKTVVLAFTKPVTPRSG